MHELWKLFPFGVYEMNISNHIYTRRDHVLACCYCNTKTGHEAEQKLQENPKIYFKS